MPGPGATGARAALLVGAAVILGLILLRNVPDELGADVPTASPTTTSNVPTVSIIPPTTPRAARPPAEVKVLTANGTGTSGLAGKTSEFLRQNGYNVLAPTDANPPPIEMSRVEFRDGFEPEARALAATLQLPAGSVRPLETDPPVAETRSADVLVLLGADLVLPGDTTSTTRR